MSQAVFETVIPYNITVAEAPAYGQLLGVYAPRSSGASAYECLAQELEGRYGES